MSKLLLEVRVYSGLEIYLQNIKYGQPMPVDMPSGATVEELLQQIKIPKEEVFSILVNGTHRHFNYVLQDGERVAFFPPVGGG